MVWATRSLGASRSAIRHCALQIATKNKSVKRFVNHYVGDTPMPNLVSGIKIIFWRTIIRSAQWGLIEIYSIFSSMIIEALRV
jgi:hypothetical protein